MSSLTKKATSQVKRIKNPSGIKWGIYCKERKEFVYGISEHTKREAFEMLKEKLGVDNPLPGYVVREVVL